MKEGKKVVLNPETKPIAREIFEMYWQGKSAKIISKYIKIQYDIDLKPATIEKIVRNPIYAGIVIFGGETYEDIVEAILTKEEWTRCEEQLKRNQEHNMRKETYIFFQKLRCPHCGTIMGSTHSMGSGGKKTFFYYQCAKCKVRNINEEVIEKLVIKEIAEVIDYYMIADVGAVATGKNDIDIIDYATLTEIEKRNSTKYNLRTIDTWNSLSREAKQLMIMDFIEDIDFDFEEIPNGKAVKKEITLREVNFKEEKIQHMAELFHKGLMDMVVKIKDKNVLVSNRMREAEIAEFINRIQLQYKVKTFQIESDKLDWNKIDTDRVVRIMPHNSSKYEIKYTVMAM